MDDDKDTIWVTSIYGARTKTGLVNLRWDGKEKQLTPQEARAHATNIMECAEAAETDHFLITFLQEKTGVSLEQAARILIDFREFRDRQRKAHGPSS